MDTDLLGIAFLSVVIGAYNIYHSEVKKEVRSLRFYESVFAFCLMNVFTLRVGLEVGSGHTSIIIPSVIIFCSYLIPMSYMKFRKFPNAC
jgi:hypothetical protein